MNDPGGLAALFAGAAALAAPEVEPTRRAPRLVEAFLPKGARPPRAVRLAMRGEIKLGAWRSFVGEEVLTVQGDFVWRAQTKLYGLPVSGFDAFVGGVGLMRWKLFGLVPMLSASGPDLALSAAARAAGECFWLPSRLLSPEVELLDLDPSTVLARIPACGQIVEVRFDLGPDDLPVAVSFDRIGIDKGRRFVGRFGGFLAEWREFNGVRLPTAVRAGWKFGSPDFEASGEFFRAEVLSVEFR